MKIKYLQRKQRYTNNECFLIASLIKNKIDIFLNWTEDSIFVDQSENLLTDIRNRYGERLLRIFNHIEINRIYDELIKLKGGD
jgi:hypothetical protein